MAWRIFSSLVSNLDRTVSPRAAQESMSPETLPVCSIALFIAFIATIFHISLLLTLWCSDNSSFLIILDDKKDSLAQYEALDSRTRSWPHNC